MSTKTAGYSFLVEFNQRLINKVVNALFEDDDGVKTNFDYDEPGQPGLLSSRRTESGRRTYKRYLLEGLLGYELDLYEPHVLLHAGSRQNISLSVKFNLTVLRQLKIFKTPDQLHIPYDLDTVDPDGDYDLAYDTGLHPEHKPSCSGRLVITLNIMALPFGPGNRVTIKASESELDLVESVELQIGDLEPNFEAFLEVMAAKAITTVFRREVKEIDITPQFGVFNAYGVSLRKPIHLRIGKTKSEPALAVGMHEWSLVEDGRPDKIQFITDEHDLGIQIDEAFLTYLIVQMQNSEIIPRRLNKDGKADPNGRILLHNVRLSLEDGAFRIHLEVEYDGIGGLFAKTLVLVNINDDGEISLRLEDTSLHIGLAGLLAGFQVIFNSITFYLFDKLFGKILGDLLEAIVNRDKGKTLDNFLSEEVMTFVFNSPLRNSSKSTQLSPMRLQIEPGRLITLGNIKITD